MEKRPKPASLSSPSSSAWFHLLMRARPPKFSGKLLEGSQSGGGKDLAFLRRFKAHNKNALSPSARTGAAAVQWSVGGLLLSEVFPSSSAAQVAGANEKARGD